MKEGLYQRWYQNDNGSEQLTKECTYKDDKIDGLYQTWYSNGQLNIK